CAARSAGDIRGALNRPESRRCLRRFLSDRLRLRQSLCHSTWLLALLRIRRNCGTTAQALLTCPAFFGECQQKKASCLIKPLQALQWSEARVRLQLLVTDPIAESAFAAGAVHALPSSRTRRR